MALIEVDEGEYAAARRVTEDVAKLLGNPKTRRKLLEAQKELNPHLSIPELDAHEPIRNEVSELSKTLAELRAELAADKAERERQAQLSTLQKTWDSGRGKLRANGYTDDGLAEIEKFMEEKGIADHEVAAAAFERMHPADEPVKSIGGNRFDLFSADDRSDESMKALFSNPDDPIALDKLVNDTLRQVRGR